MKLKNILILIFFLVVLIPSLLFWAWPYSKALDSEIYEVKERHLVIANNLAMALERYYQDTTNAFTILSYHLGREKNKDEANDIIEVYDFQTVMLVSKKDWHVIDCIRRKDVPCNTKINNNVLEFIKNTSNEVKTQISPVLANKNFENNSMLLVTRPVGDNLAVGYLSTRYIVDVGKRVAFGKKGHAAIVDQNGHVMAHPLTEWIKTQKSMEDTSVVQKMMAGKTGVETFISPAFLNKMIAGYAAVPDAGWGVMVPQPLAELHKKAEAIDRTALLVMMLGLGIALLIAIPVSFMITKPLEKLTELTRIIGYKDEYDIDLDIKKATLLPLEVRKLNENFIEMMNQLKENRKSISRLAYMDINTGLPNRNYFQKLARHAIEEMMLAHTCGAVLFIDFDGFKKINDTYGHRTGDELLSMFAKRLMIHFSLWDKKIHNDSWLSEDTPTDVIPARLGGDEFVVFFKHIQDAATAKKRAEDLMKNVFGDYDLYGNIRITLSGSVGVAMFPEDGSTYEEIIKAADVAMYNAKDQGKDTLCFFKA